jgi:tRNA (guanosine-2'-O-)-methyltransferase
MDQLPSIRDVSICTQQLFYGRLIVMEHNPELIAYLSGFVTPERLARMQAVLANRSRYLTVVLEDIYQSHNASAVLRTCDAFGIQDVHIIEKRNEYKVNPDIALGSAQWLSLKKYRNERADSVEVVKNLKNQGYRVVATAPHAQGGGLFDFNLENGPVALVFGTEQTGISTEIMETADEFLTIPMYGFVESFNISVSVAICLAHLSQEMRQKNLNWQLSDQEIQDLLFSWLKSSVKQSDKIIANYRAKN